MSEAKALWLDGSMARWTEARMLAFPRTDGNPQTEVCAS